MRPFSLVLAATQDSGIGCAATNDLPWGRELTEDLKSFQKLTSITSDPNLRNAVIMGRKTWDSIPVKFRPLANRFNIVLTTNQEDNKEEDQNNVVFVPSWKAAFEAIEKENKIESIFVIGGATIYEQAITQFSDVIQSIYLTTILTPVRCDVFVESLTDILKRMQLIDTSQLYTSKMGIKYEITKWINNKLLF